MSTRQVSSIVAAIALLVLGVSSCVRKSPPGVEKNAGTGVQPTPEAHKPAPRVILLLVIDKTQSPSEAALQEFVPKIGGALRDCEVLREIFVVDDGANGLSPWNAETQEFSLSIKAAKPFDEEAARANARMVCKGRGNCEEKMIREARADFDAKAAANASTSEQDRAATLERVTAAILQRPVAEPPCTDVAEMADRIARTPATHVIWLTDGIHGCTTPLKPQTFENKVLVALMPVEKEKNFSRRLAELSDLYPTANIKPITTLNGSVVLEFLKGS